MLDEVLLELDDKMEKAVKSFEVELGKVRTGRASPSMLEVIKVDYYGTPTPINQMASVSTPEARMLVVQPWDQSSLELIEKAIQASDLGIVPQNDGKIIRLPIPPLTEERRKEFAKLVGKLAEDARVSIRNVRRFGMDELKKAEKDKTISEDDQKKGQEKIQSVTDQFIKKVDDLADSKSKEILEI